MSKSRKIQERAKKILSVLAVRERKMRMYKFFADLVWILLKALCMLTI